jgi:predicted nuclease of restriction endonuclease-like RecB superfamily
MLPSDLLMHRPSGESVIPKRLALNVRNLAIANELIALFQAHCGKTQGKLNQQLQELEGEDTDYRVKRGLAHLLRNSFSTFDIVSPLDPQDLRQRVFELAARQVQTPHYATQTLSTLAQTLSRELGQEVRPDQIHTGLYADLAENRILTQFDAPTPEALLHRYNLSQVQGIFYKASQITINAHRNNPGEYKLLFRYLKLFGLMAYIEGDADHGFTITIDGPTSLFKPSTRYGLDIAKLLPALLHVTKWSLNAELQIRDSYSDTAKSRLFMLDSECGLVSHYPPGKPYDSLLEASFVQRWQALNPAWQLEREVDLIPIPGSVMIPDFRLVHPDGRTFLLEIVGYWRPEYLRKKFSQVRQSERDDLILAVSERLNLEKAGVNVNQVPARVVWFKNKLTPKAILSVLDDGFQSG